MLAELRTRATWLPGYAHRVTSKCGEDGITEKALDLLPTRNRWCVELGAHGGVSNSNTCNMIYNHEYSAVLIECDEKKFCRLSSNYQGCGRVIPLNHLVQVRGQTL
jgi:hypothetical protein